MAEHTPGPWRVDGDGDTISIIASGLDDCCRFGVVGEWDVATIDVGDAFIGNPDAIANAHLIAAAPELLEALEEFCARVDAGEVRSKRTYAKFKSLIARAKGGAS